MNDINNNIEKLFKEVSEVFALLIRINQPLQLSLQPAVGFHRVPTGPLDFSVSLPVRVVTGKGTRPAPNPDARAFQPVTDQPQGLSAADLREMKRICAANGEVRRLMLLTSYEQLLAGLRLMHSHPEARARHEAELQQQLLLELSETIE